MVSGMRGICDISFIFVFQHAGITNNPLFLFAGMKKRVLVMPDGNWLSHTSRPLEIAKALRKYDCEIIFAGEGRYMALAAAEGFSVEPLLTLDPLRALDCSRRGRANWFLYEFIKSCVEADTVLFRRLQPDLVLTDFRLPTGISCRVAGIPQAVVLNASWTNFYAVQLKAPEHLAFTRIVGRGVATALMPLLKEFILALDARPFNRYRRELGLPECRNIWEIWRGDLNLIADIPEYGPTQDLPSDYSYIGPIVWEPPPGRCLENWPAGLDPSRPVLYFTMGSTGDPRLFRHAVNLFGDSDYQCIITTGGLADLGEVPGNIHVTDYAPGSMLMRKSDVVICQGGNGTIYQAMKEGVPIIGISTLHDQEFNLERVESLGIGIALSDLRFTSADLMQAVKTILSTPAFKYNALKYRAILQDFDGPSAGARLIASFLEKGQPSAG
jgi:UDP:flavonoid glycosyltransferase YjiC (YdhE family)